MNITAVKACILITLMVLIATANTAMAQRINFTVWARSNSISIQSASGYNTLSFGTMFPGVVKSIAITGNDALVFEISAETGYDMLVSFTSPQVLTGPSGKTMPFNLKFAYFNQGTSSLSVARNGAIEVPAGFTSVAFPIKSGISGPPAPPPVPLDGATVKRPRDKAYLFVYGSAGPAAKDATSGDYSGNIIITVDYNQ
jgi:hypothetical protein